MTGYEGTALNSLNPGNTDLFLKARSQGAPPLTSTRSAAMATLWRADWVAQRATLLMLRWGR